MYQATVLIAFYLPIVVVIGVLIFLAIPIPVDINDKKRLNIARVLSIVFPGLGHVLMGSIVRGILLVLLWISFLIVMAPRLFMIISGVPVENPFIDVFLLPLIIWLSSIIGLSGLRKKKQINSIQEQSKSL